MRSDILTVALLLITSTPAFAHPQYIPEGELIARDNDFEQRDVSWDNVARDDLAYVESVIEQRDLFKRKGGGGGGGKGGGGSSSSGKGGSGSSSGSSGSSSGSGSSGSSSSSSGRGSSSSSIGGSTKTGSGPTPRFGGGRYYGGGATTPYAAGRTSPLGIAPAALLVGAGALAIFPGLWLYGAYSYPYHHPYTFRNHSANATNTTRELQTRQTDLGGVNETKPVTCLCAQYAECGCDDSGNTTVLDELIGDGSYDSLNKTLVNVADDGNGTSTIFINGTLPNGTTASGGSDNANLAGMRMIAQSSGYWVMVAIVAATCWMI